MPQPSVDSNLVRVSLHKVGTKLGRSHGYILKAHMNERTLLNNIMDFVQFRVPYDSHNNI